MTNDGATILKLLEVEHPAARVLVDLAQLQDEEVGDGTTSVVILEFWFQTSDLNTTLHDWKKMSYTGSVYCVKGTTITSEVSLKISQEINIFFNVYSFFEQISILFNAVFLNDKKITIL